MPGDFGEQLRRATGRESHEATKKSYITIGSLTISVGDIITVTQSEQVFLPHGTVSKDFKVLSIDPKERTIIFEGFEDPLHASIVEDGLVTLAQSGGQEKRKPVRETEEHIKETTREVTLHDSSTVKVGDTIRISLSTGKVLAEPIIEQILSDHEVIADGKYIENIKIPQIKKITK